MFLTRVGLAALAFAAVYSFFSQPILSLFGWATATYDALPQLPAGPQFPGVGGNSTNPGDAAGWYDFLFWLGVSVMNFVSMVAYKTAALFFDMGNAMAGAVPDPQVANAIRAFFYAVGALLQVAMWWVIVYAARSGQV